MSSQPGLKKGTATSNGFSRNNYDSCVYFKEFAPGTAALKEIDSEKMVQKRDTLYGDFQDRVDLMYLWCAHTENAYAVAIESKVIDESREIVESKEIEVAKIGTKDNAADAFTKVVPGKVKKRQKEAKTVKNRQETEKARQRVKTERQSKAGSARYKSMKT
ncbi:hypothetical protein Tco_0821035 [Tanacetum coccineum]|uniref:Uncharacterized protein n=1 Tax=Tanacetum coccineum TaxID=301880 RepID=A0ABQ5AFC0_9ASTR